MLCDKCAHKNVCMIKNTGCAYSVLDKITCDFLDESQVLPFKAGDRVILHDNYFGEGVIRAIHISDTKETKRKSHVVVHAGVIKGLNGLYYLEDYGKTWEVMKDDNRASN